MLQADFFWLNVPTFKRPNVLTERGNRKLLFAKNDSRFCQVVWRKLHGNFVPRHDSDEMLAHFAGNMRKDIALPGKIDAEHRPRQNLRHSALRNDLFFLRHCAANIPRQRPALKAAAHVTPALR